MMSSNFRSDWGKKSFSHTHTTFQTVIPAPGSRPLAFLILHILSAHPVQRSLQAMPVSYYIYNKFCMYTI